VATVIDQAVCIRQWDWSETSQTVSVFSRAHGVLRGIAKGSRREHAPFSGGIEVLTRAEVSAIVKPASDLANITAWDLQETFPALRRSLPSFYTAMYMIDLVHHALSERDPHPLLFDALLDALRALAEPAGSRAALLRFQWAALSDTGYRPELDLDVTGSSRRLPAARTYAFLPRLGGFTDDSPAPPPPAPYWRVRAETLDLLRLVANGALPATGEFAAGAEASNDSLDRATRLLAAYFREVLGRDIPSMTALFGDVHP
jgi:DNA repair protein RecO (recombination protein O)